MMMHYSFGRMPFFFHGMGFTMFIFVMAVLGIIVYTIIKGAGNSARNASSPVLTVGAVLISKRFYVHNHHTWHYMTFQFESGDRMEFGVSDRDYGLLAEGDRGSLTFQGTRFMGFQRV